MKIDWKVGFDQDTETITLIPQDGEGPIKIKLGGYEGYRDDLIKIITETYYRGFHMGYQNCLNNQ